MKPTRRPAKKSADLRTPLLFGLIGLLNTGIDYGLFLLLSAAGLPALLAHAVSYTAGLVNSFFWNKFLTFRSRRLAAGEAARFLIVNLAALALAGGVLELGMKVFGLHEFAAKAIALPFSLALNYLGNRFWVFPGERGTS